MRTLENIFIKSLKVKGYHTKNRVFVLNNKFEIIYDFRGELFDDECCFKLEIKQALNKHGIKVTGNRFLGVANVEEAICDSFMCVHFASIGVSVDTSSVQFIELYKVVNAVRFCKEKVCYNLYTEKGQLGIDKSIEWVKSNTDLTPLQTAIKKWNGSTTSVCDFNTVLPVCNVSYESFEELDAKLNSRISKLNQ